jgi:hypothetical protein
MFSNNIYLFQRGAISYFHMLHHLSLHRCLRSDTAPTLRNKENGHGKET